MRMQMIRLTEFLLAVGLVVGCLANGKPTPLALYELPVNQQREFFLDLDAEKQIEVLLASFKRKQAWDMRLLEWLAVSRGDVARAVRERVAYESDNWQLETLALAVERLSAQTVCRMSGNEAHVLLKVINEKMDDATARSTVQRVLSRHDRETCKN